MPTPWRVMAVDDDRDILELIRLSLDGKYCVITFDEPKFALQSLDLVEPDLIILDIMMPKLTGYQFIEAVKGHRRFADIPVVFLSAKDANRDIKYGYKLGASVYLTKPFQPDRLLRNIDSLFTRTPPPMRTKKYAIEEVQQRLKIGSEFGYEVPQDSKPFAGGSATPKPHGKEEEEQPVDKTPDWLD